MHPSNPFLGPADKQLLFDFMDSCHMEVSSIEQDVMPRLQGLMGHRLFAYGSIDFGVGRKLRLLGGNLPGALAEEELSSRKNLVCILIMEWLKQRTPVFSAALPADPAMGLNEPQCLAVHGIVDVAQRSATWYAFSRTSFGQREHYILRIAIPHLHAALTTTMNRARVPAGLDRLTPREMEVLHWLSKGKANAEISLVLGISVCTVRVHIQNIFNKLPANNRTHAAARAMQLGLVDGGQVALPA